LTDSLLAGSPPALADTSCLVPDALLVLVCLLITGTKQAGQAISEALHLDHSDCLQAVRIKSDFPADE
ncbi:MAG: hypothetical protein JWM43_2374, partial [Acidobacteriaceae bacterium]|nr:hypothetical protein [Acidobacteriaceae bacterium]